MKPPVTHKNHPVRPAPAALLDRWAKRQLLKILGRLRYGRITLEDGAERAVFGGGKDLEARITVRHPAFYRKALFGGSIGAGEGYFQELWDVDDLTALVRILLRNMELMEKMEGPFTFLMRPVNLLSHALNDNSRVRARRNILSHYDIGNDLYESFLDPALMYSCAIYPQGESSLEAASLHKLETICRKLDLKPRDRVVEIGTGWGGFAIHAARHHGCHVTTTTISEAQYGEAKRRIEAAGLGGRITLLRKDYRDLTGRYDKLVSIEMIEAVGHRYLPDFFKKCGELLEKDGAMLLQAITIPDQRYDAYVRSVDFIQRYIFPGGCLVSNRRIIDLITEKTDMVVRHLEDFGLHYARTLRDWRARFTEAFDTLRQKGCDETFRRLWEFYLCYCEGGFLERAISVVQVTAVRPGHRGSVPPG